VDGFLGAGIDECATDIEGLIGTREDGLHGHDVATELEQELLRKFLGAHAAKRAGRSRDDGGDLAGKRVVVAA
jgi:hypothetical protein